MNFLSSIQGLQDLEMTARGNAPGKRAEACPTMIGRNEVSFNRTASEICVALTGLDLFDGVEPRALPWAIIFRPFRAQEERVRT